MGTLTERTTIYLNPYVKKFLQYQAVEQGKSLSELVNEQAAELLEDAQDIEAASKRAGEPTIAWEKVKSELKRDGLL